MPIFVFYSDDYPDNGGIGMQECCNKDEAAKFIQDRMASQKKPDIKCYTVIEGKELGIKVAEVVTRVLL